MSEEATEQKKDPDPSLKGVIGLMNLGNTCYANSVIQILRSISDLSVYILNESLSSKCINLDSNPVKILLGYQDLLKS